MTSGRADSRLGKTEFRQLRDVIHEHCGIFFDDDTAYLVERRLRTRLEDLGLADFASYVHHLTDNGRAARMSELEEIVERVTTNETYFFRESYQLDAFRYEIMPALKETKSRSRRLRVWSAGCSTGEEAYTIAILMVDSGLFQGWDLSVVGTDISRRVLDVARAGVFGASSFRSTDDRYLRQYFVGHVDRHRVRDDIKGMVSFRRVNLLELDALPEAGTVDVVFCRNVLIYFGQEARRRVVESLYRQLVSGGYLLLGHSESLANLGTRFELVHLKNDMVYQKPRRVR